MASSRRLAVLLVLTAAVHAACWTPPTAVRGRLAAQRKTVLLVDQAAPFRVTMRPDAAGALGIEVDANESGAAVIKSIVRGSRVSELLEVGDAPQPGCTRAPPVQATCAPPVQAWPPLCTDRASSGKGPANLPHGTGLRRLALSGPMPKSPEGCHGPCVRRWGRGCHLPPRTVPHRASHGALHCALLQWRARSTVGHARYLPLMLRYLPPQVVVQVNGCDTPTLGAVVDVVSAQASPATAKLLPHTLLEHGAHAWPLSLQTIDLSTLPRSPCTPHGCLCVAAQEFAFVLTMPGHNT